MNKLFTIITLILLCTVQVFAQTNVKGKVTDKNGEPLPGVNVVLKQGDKTIQGVITDMDGNYTLTNVPADAAITFTFMGMAPQTIQVKGKSVMDIILQDNVKDLDEVVVVGYGVQKRANLTGSVSTITSEELKDIPSVNLSTALEGKLSGLSVSQASGKPGAATSLQIRANTSYGVEEGILYVIDDVLYPATENGQAIFDLLDPSEVESITILKDANAAAYGVQGGAGVIVVKTKKGKQGKTKVNYSGSFGITKAINISEMLSAYDLATLLNDQILIGTNYNKTKAALKSNWYTDDELQYYKDSIPGGRYNWFDNVWHNGTIMHHSLNFSGGNEKITYFVGGNYLKEKGAIDNLYAEKYTIRANTAFEVFKNLNATIETVITNSTDRSPVNPNDSETDLMKVTFAALLQSCPWIPPTIRGLPVNVSNNPYSIWNAGDYKRNETNTFNGTGILTYNIPFVKGLSAKYQFNKNWQYSEGKTYYAKSLGYNFVYSGDHSHILRPDAALDTSNPYTTIDGTSSLQESYTKSTRYQSDISLNYANKFGLHNLSAMAICEIAKYNSKQIGWKKTDQVIDGIDEAYAFSTIDQNSILATSKKIGGSIGFITKANYDYNSKYLIEYIGRVDASTKFAPERRWGFSPSLSAGWVVSEEKFFKQTFPAVNFFKLRASAGLLGIDNISDFTWELTYGSQTADYTNFGVSPLGIRASNAGYYNRDVSWQKTLFYNFGYDLKFFNNKLGFTADGFYKYTYDILIPVTSTIPGTTGISGNNIKFNYGIMHGYGFEIELKYGDKILKDFKYEIKGNFSFAESKKLKVPQAAGAVGTWYDETKNFTDNQPGAISLGIMRTDKQLKQFMSENPNYQDNGEELQAGMLYFKDIRGADLAEGPNGTFDFSLTEDRTVIAKHTDPVYHYGTTITLSWKDLTISGTFSGKFGNKVFYDKNAVTAATATTNVPSFWKDHWTPENTNAKYPRAADFGLEGQYSTFWMRNGHTLRLTDFNISYALPAKVSNLMGISQLRAFMNAKYLWTIISPFSYKDADIAYYNSYPMTSNITFGLNASF